MAKKKNAGDFKHSGLKSDFDAAVYNNQEPAEETKVENIPVPAEDDNEFKNVTTRFRKDVYKRLQRMAYWERTTVVDILDSVMKPYIDQIEQERGQYLATPQENKANKRKK